MGNPSAPIAALDALGSRLAVLLAAADRGATSDASGLVWSALTPEDRAFWDEVPPEITRDVGVFVATTDATADALALRMRKLFDMGIADLHDASKGILCVAVASFHGLKIAKRWDVLQVASISLLDVVADAIQQRLEKDDASGVLVLMDFYAAILLGFQHSGELVARAQPQIKTLAPLVAAIGHEALTRRFLVIAAALAHYHRAYEDECTAIRASLLESFSTELVQRPIAECEAALREAAWILPATTLNQYLPTIEGKWIQDEFSSEQHASAAATPQNAGSITFKKAANVLAYYYRATMDDFRKKTQVQLDGALFRALQTEDENASWQLEGHWRHVVESAGAAGSTGVQIVAPIIQAESWVCGACTVKNEGHATKCTTCGSEAPKNTSSQTTPTGAKTTNPAPFQAVFDADHTVMRMRWSRGEQSGVWLAKKETQNLEFDLGESLREASASAMVDSNAIPTFAYSPRGEASRVLLLEKTYALSTYGEIAMELWIQVEAFASDQTKQTILATGEFELFLQQEPTESLVWNVGSGMHVVSTTSASLVDGQFHHVALLFGKRFLQIVVDGVVVGEVDRGVTDPASIPSRRSAWVSVGGSISDEGQQMESCFHGAILDLRIWSDLNARSLFSSDKALGGTETGLIGYFPMVGNSHRILQDASKHDNHATVFGDRTTGLVGTGGQLNNTLLAPFAAVGTLPVANHFSSALGDFEMSGRAAHIDKNGGSASALRLDHPSAIWHNSPVSIAEGFRSIVTLESIKLLPSQSSQLVFAMCEASFWDAPTMIAEASSLGLPYDAEHSENRYGGAALFVVLERVATDAAPTDLAGVAVYIWKNRRPLQLCRMSGLPLSSDVQTGLAVTYTQTSHVMTIEVPGSGAKLEVGVDIDAALELQSSPSRVRSGIILASPMPSSSYSSEVTKWTFETMKDHQDTANVSAVHQIYSRLRQGSPSKTESAGLGTSDLSVPTISCTRTSSDGSAIEQATYGCQTCGVVHGAGLCSVCALVCHDGHELVYMGSMITACACAMRTGYCKCVTPVAASEYPRVGQSLPRVAQWYCNRCTVVNSAEVRECTVCANAAPDVSVLGRTPTNNAPESTSRALVPVTIVDTPPLIHIPSEWSCPACTYLNTGDASKCTICDSARPTSDPPAAQTERDGLVTLYNAAESQLQSQSTPVVAAASTSPWQCAACTMENKAADNVCFMCQTVRAIPVADPVTPESIPVGLPVATTDAALMATPMETDSDRNPMISEASANEGNAHRLARVQLANTFATCGELIVQKALADTTWDSTGGVLRMAVDESAFIAQYMEGEYAEKDGYVRGLAHLSPESPARWKLGGRFKKISQSQENAVSLTWELGMTRFDGKWFRGDGSGEWKCVAAPLINDFRGLAPVDPSKPSVGVQPFYSGLINMKQNLTNVCYQNSFLQSLFLTQEFRRLMLSSQMDDYANLPLDMGSGSQGNVLHAIQELFARLIASQRPELDSHVLQRCLPTTFQAGRQQDTSDFAHFLIDSLSQQLNQHHTTAHGIDNIFGGTQATIIGCKVCGKKSINREYFWEMMLNMIDLRYTPITSISAVSGITSEISTPSGYERINSDLNKDRDGVPYVYLCVKRKPEVSSTVAEDSFYGASAELPITDLIVKVVGFADVKPVVDGYERVELDLNIGGSTVVMGGKKQVYLFYRREPNGSPITDLQVIYGTESVPDGFKQIRVDLNQGEGTKVFLCYRCDMPITDMKIVNTGIPGYRMVDHVLNRTNEDIIKQYLAFKVGGSDPCITDLKLIPASDAATYLEQGWETLGSPSSTVEDGTPPDILVIRRGHGNPIFAVDVFRAPRQVPKYNDYEVIDVYGNRPPQASAETPTTAEAIASMLKGDWLADESVDRGRKAVRIHSVSDSIADGLVIKGSFDDKGEVTAVATASSSSWSNAFTGDQSGAAAPPSRVLRVTGHWSSSKTKQAQLFDVELRPGVGTAEASNAYTLSGTIGDGRGRPVAITGTQTSNHARVKWPISEIFVLRGDERVPEGIEVVRETCSGKTGNLLAQTQSPHTLYLAVKRVETPSEGSVGDLCVIYGDIDAVPENYTCVQTTPSGHSANLNDGTNGVPIFICYRRVNASTEKCLMDLALMWTSGAQADTLPAGFTKIQHTPLGMDANLNQGTTGVSIHLCFAKCDPADVVRPVDDPLNGEYEITIASATASGTLATLPPLMGKFIRLSVAERIDVVHTLEGKFGTVFHGYQPGMVRGTYYHSQQRRKRVITGVWMSDEPNAASMIDFVPPSFPFEWALNDANNELDGWWSTADEVSSNTTPTTPAPGSSSSSATGSSTSTPTARPWKIMKDAYVRIAFKKDYGTEWKHGELVSSERVWRHDVQSMLSRFVASRTLGGDNLLSCSQCDRKTESRTHTVVVAPPAHLILTIKRMFYDWNQQKTRKSLHDVSFSPLLTLPALTSEDEDAVYDADNVASQLHRKRQYGLYGVLVHSGLTANSGHYFSFCRESDDGTKQLHQEDAPLAPWIKFNDSKVERSSWTEINAAVSSSVSDTVYLLLYKRLSYDVPSIVPTLEEATAMDVDAHTDDEDEAMLLAKAMALSMSAAEKKAQAEAEAKAESKEEGAEEEESMVGAVPPAAEANPRAINRAVIREVEAANTHFLFDTMRSAASGVHVQDLHTTLALQLGLDVDQSK